MIVNYDLVFACDFLSQASQLSSHHDPIFLKIEGLGICREIFHRVRDDSLRSEFQNAVFISSDRSSERSEFTFDDVVEMARNSLGEDAFGYRAELVTLVERARVLSAAPVSNR